jgi:hypothetical protein
MLLKLLAKLLHKCNCGHGRRVAQWAKRPSQHVFRQVLNIVDVLGLAKSRMEAGQ